MSVGFALKESRSEKQHSSNEESTTWALKPSTDGEFVKEQDGGSWTETLAY